MRHFEAFNTMMEAALYLKERRGHEQQASSQYTCKAQEALETPWEQHLWRLKAMLRGFMSTEAPFCPANLQDVQRSELRPKS